MVKTPADPVDLIPRGPHQSTLAPLELLQRLDSLDQLQKVECG